MVIQIKEDGMLFIFDKHLDTEKRIEISYYSEQVRNKKLTGNIEIKIEQQSDFPDIHGFSDDTLFTALEVTDGALTVPIIGTYNCIESFNASYVSGSRIYQINMVLGYKAET